MFARIEEGIVQEILDLDMLPEFHPSLFWLECPVGTQEGYIYQDGSFIDPQSLITESEKQDTLKAYLAAYRYRKENGGISFNDHSVHTDRDSRTSLIAARILATENPSFTQNWKTTSGFITLDATTAQNLAAAVLNHVSLCFDTEQALRLQIDAGELTSESEIEQAFDLALS